MPHEPDSHGRSQNKFLKTPGNNSGLTVQRMWGGSMAVTVRVSEATPGRPPGSGERAGSRRVPDDELGLEFHPQRLEPPVLDLPEQDADRGPAHLGERLPDRDERRDDDLRFAGVVETDDRQVGGEPEPTRPGRLRRADRHAVVEREDRG